MTRPESAARSLDAPEVPNTSYLDATVRETRSRAAASPRLTSAHTGAPDGLLSALRLGLGDVAAEALELSHEIFGFAEPGFAEHHSVEAIRLALERHGVDGSVGGWGLETSIQASVGSSDGPTIALLAEYDALPGIGHGCGHNVIAAASVGAFLALASLGDALPGRAVLLGTPAEEGGGGKELLARAGAFAGIDAAIMVHPFGYDAADHPFIGRRIVRVRYLGVASHASATPFMGRNALDAASLNYQAVGFLRQHLPPGDRVHGVIVSGGDRPNIVPEFAELEYYVRSPALETLKDLSRRLDDIAHGIALATGTGVEIEWDPMPFTVPIRFNGPLNARWAVRQQERGRRVLTRDAVPSHLAASTDFGNVSVRIPSIHPVIAVGPEQGVLHTREFAEHAVSEAGDLAVVDGADGLAATALDYLTDAALRQAVRDDFDAAGGIVDVEGYFR